MLGRWPSSRFIAMVRSGSMVAVRPRAAIRAVVSAIRRRDVSISAGSSCVARTGVSVSTHMGPALRLKASFSQMRSRIAGSIATGSPACVNAAARAVMPGVAIPSGAPRIVARFFGPRTRTTPGSGTELAGQAMPPTVRRPTAFQIVSPGSSSGRRLPVPCTAMAVEIPPGHAVGQEGDRRVRPEQGRHRGRRGGHGGGLDRDQHGILRAQFRRVGAGRHARGEGFVRRLHRQPVGLDRRQVRAAGHHGHVQPGARHVAGEEAADCACAEDAYPQGRSSP